MKCVQIEYIYALHARTIEYLQKKIRYLFEETEEDDDEIGVDEYA